MTLAQELIQKRDINTAAQLLNEAILANPKLVEAYTEAADDGTVSIFVNFDDTVVSKVSFYAQALQNRAATVGANFSHLYDAETLEVLEVLV